jgi:hypothetical protein
MKQQQDIVLLDPAVQEKYEKTFRKRVFHLVYEGYVRLNKNGKDYSVAIEESISHDLADEIENFSRDCQAPRWSRWCEKFSVHRERPVSPHGEEGRSRPRLDIRIRSGESPICPEFVFEAKRLRHDTESADYFGEEGMECFWNGTYPINIFREAGMLGYIQNKDAAHWTDWLKKHFEKRRSALHVCIDSDWELTIQFQKLQHTFCTQHQPIVDEERVIIFHLLLPFC